MKHRKKSEKGRAAKPPSGPGRSPAPAQRGGVRSRRRAPAWGWWLAGLVLVVVAVYIQWHGDSAPTGAAQTATPPSTADSAGRQAPAPSEPELPLSERARRAVNQGNDWLERNQPTNAIASFKQALEWTPDDEDVHYNLGIAYARAGDRAGAEQHYRRALELAPDNPEVHNNLGNLLTRLTRYEEAEKHFQEALRLLPGHAVTHNGLGMLYLKMDRPAEARSHFEQAVKADPQFWEAWFNLGQSRADAHLWEAAAEALREVLKLQPLFAPAQQSLARVEEQLRPAPPLAPLSPNP